MDLSAMNRTCRQQSGVISRRQALAVGATENDLRRMVRRRELSRVHPGVFVNHTGSLSWEQRAWAAVLTCAPAALAGASALRAHGLRRHGAEDLEAVELLVSADRRVVPPPGVRASRSIAFAAQVQLHLSPPRQRLENAVIQVAGRAAALDAAVALAADAVQSGRTTVSRLRRCVPARRPARSLAVLADILDDIESGAYSALERRYLRAVERAHGLPCGARQRRVRIGRDVHYRDVEYVGLRTLVELDGRIGHEWNADRWADLERDLASAAAGNLTLRAGWRQVSNRAAWPPSSAGCSSSEGGMASCVRADPRAPPSTELSSHWMTGILRCATRREALLTPCAA
jgi:hypothetical protein